MGGAGLGWHNKAARRWWWATLLRTTKRDNKARGSVHILDAGGYSVGKNKDKQFNYVPYVVPGENEGAANYPCVSDEVEYLPGSPFALSYANPGKQPVQSSDWWTSLGFQLNTWVLNRGNFAYPSNCNPPTVRHATTQFFYSEPFQFAFVDYLGGTVKEKPPGTDFPPGFTPEAGLAIRNLNTFQVAADAQTIVKQKPIGYNTNADVVNWGSPAPDYQARVTVGLENTVSKTTMHPLRADKFPDGPPTDNRWTNIQVESYSDWAVVASVHDEANANKLQITMANGSPFVWFERTQGSDAFDVWVGGIPLPGKQFGTYKLVTPKGANPMIVEVKTYFNGDYDGPGANPNASDAFYVIQADKGQWKEVGPTEVHGEKLNVQEFQNTDATSVIVTALPHNIPESGSVKADQTTADMAWAALKPYACLKTVNTKLILPTPAQSTKVGNQTFLLGYDPAGATVTGELQITTAVVQGFANQCSQDPAKPFQLVFPHHRQELIAAQQGNIQAGTSGTPMLWNSLMGPVMGYLGNTMFLQSKVKGIMPVLPSVAIDNPSLFNPNPPTPACPGIATPLPSKQTAAEDIYDTLKCWYFMEEPFNNKAQPTSTPTNGIQPKPPANGHLDSYPRNPGTYMGVGFNTYLNGTTTPRELLTVADQLAKTNNPMIKGVLDPQLGESKDVAAAEMRNFLLQSLEDTMIGEWADVFTANLLEYNPVYSTLYGYPAGYGDVQSLSDHHYHYGYFLRAAAEIGRYDLPWLWKYTQIFADLLNDVAAFDNGASGFPQLRNFNPYYGHSWADGAAYGGNNQESTSEAINFEVGMVELGDELRNNNWRDLGLYLYEQEITSVEQYWFNLNADLTDTETSPQAKCPTKAPYFLLKSDPEVCYNGNWPRSFVTYKSSAPPAKNTVQHHTMITRVFNEQLSRTTFFDDSPAAGYAIEFIPVAPSMLYVERNLPWLQATWKQFVNDNAFYQGQASLNPNKNDVYQDVLAALQSLLPASGTDLTGTGLGPALQRIDANHAYFQAAMNTESKYIAYTMSVLGPLDGSYSVTWPEGAAFKSGSTNTFVLDNLGSGGLSAKFIGASTSGPFSVPDNSVRSFGGTSSTFTLGTVAAPSNRLYLVGDSTNSNAPGGSLSTTPGTVIVPTTSQAQFPTTPGLLNASIQTIPVDPEQKIPTIAPPRNMMLTFGGAFSGNLVGPAANSPSCKSLNPNTNPPGPVVCDPTAVDGLQSVSRFAIYTDQCLNPGWQNCTTNEQVGNAYTMRVSYYFDTANKCNPTNAQGGINFNPDGSIQAVIPTGANKGQLCNADRVEIYANISLDNGNTWTFKNKATEYGFGGVNLSVAPKNAAGVCANPPVANASCCVSGSGPTQINCLSGFNGTFGLNVTTFDKTGVANGSLPPAICLGLPSRGTFQAYRNPGPAGTGPLVSLAATCVQSVMGPGGSVPPDPVGMFWQTVTNGFVTIELWGGSLNGGTTLPAPVPLSVSADPKSNRASWFQPPYQ